MSPGLRRETVSKSRPSRSITPGRKLCTMTSARAISALTRSNRDVGAVLRGMTWDHPRGYDPLIACSALWHGRTGVRIEWERRSLQDFESYPVAQLAQRYDLIVIDHPHVGQITRERCLLPLDDGSEFPILEKQYVGASLASYVWEGTLWALPIDAAAQ